MMVMLSHMVAKHNEKIDNLIEKLKSGNKAQNIRKNQKQSRY